MKSTEKAPSHIDLIDGNWARAAVDFARRAGAQSPVLNYGALATVLDRVRRDAGLPPAERRVAVVALDYDNENQGKLAVAMERQGIAVARVDFRHAYVSVPAGDGESKAPNPQSLTHWMTYMCGLLAVRPSPSVVLVSGAFELAGPMADFVEARGGKAVLAFFRRMLNKRWIDNGLLENEMPLRFADLEPDSREVLGVDLRAVVRRSAAERQEPGLPL